MPYQIDFDSAARAAIEVLPAQDRRTVDEAIGRLGVTHEGAKRLTGDPTLFLSRAGNRLRLLFSVNEPEKRIIVHDIVNKEAIDAMHTSPR